MYSNSTKSKRAKAKAREAAHKMAPAAPPRKLIIPRPDVLHNYLEYRQVNQYMEYIANRYSHFVKLYTLGTSHERREVRALEVNWMNADNVELPPQLRAKSAPPGAVVPPPKGPLLLPGEQGRNIVFIEAGTHAREWISITTALNCIYQLTERYTRNIEVLRKLRFIIVPLVNPDGYEYSRSKNRNWRKNRRPHKQTKFVGTDCNRNYDIFWEYGPSKVNKNTYKGEKPFSEPETRAMRNILDRLEPNLLFFLSLHSYGQSIMYPWGYSREPPHHWRELHTLATSGRSAIKSYNGREYRTGSISCLTKRTIAGSVVDYVYGVLKTPMALVMELPSRELGFQPPVEMVSQIGHESWYGIREMCKRAYDLRILTKRDGAEPKMPMPPSPPLRRRNEAEGAGTNDSQSDELARTAAGDSNVPVPVKKKSPKKGLKKGRQTHAKRHDIILDMQKRSNAAAAAGVAGLGGVAKRPLTTSTLNARQRAGCGDGPMITPTTKTLPTTMSKVTGRASAAPYLPQRFTSTLPLGVFL